MTKRYVVVDQNVLRKLLLEKEIKTQPNTHFVIQDLPFLAMTKGAKWESTLRGSLQLLADVSNRVHVAYSVNVALDRELASLQPVTGHMLHHEATKSVRDLLNSVRSGTDGKTMNLIRTDPDNHLADLSADHLDHVGNKKRLGEMIETTKSFIPEEQQKRMRATKVSEYEKLQMVHDISVGLIPQILAERGVTTGRARMFMKRRPMLLRYFFVKIWYYLRWIEKGGFDCVQEKKVTNDEIDQQYVLTASFFHGLLSEEGRVKDSYEGLCNLLKRKI